MFKKDRSLHWLTRGWVVASLLVTLTGCIGRPPFFPPEATHRTQPKATLLNGTNPEPKLTSTDEEALPYPGDPRFAPPDLTLQVPQAKSGSLYRPKYNMTLFQDRRAYRVGDMLTVKLVEESQASKNANRQLDKSVNLDIGEPDFIGKTLDKMAASADGSVSTGGTESSTQSASIDAVITVTVHEVLPNGLLRINGEKWMHLTQGDEYLRLTGYVRPEDIDRQNQVPSQRVGDARITYSGRGGIAERNSNGWMTQFFKSRWMPF